jgi:hypothetical protein
VQLGFGHSEERPNSFKVFPGSFFGSQKADGCCKTLLCFPNNDGGTSLEQEQLTVGHVQPQSKKSNKFIFVRENSEMTPIHSLNMYT